jgi:hypothetical protein
MRSEPAKQLRMAILVLQRQKYGLDGHVRRILARIKVNTAIHIIMAITTLILQAHKPGQQLFKQASIPY